LLRCFAPCLVALLHPCVSTLRQHRRQQQPDWPRRQLPQSQNLAARGKKKRKRNQQGGEMGNIIVVFS
jgi:hypothetical protein